MLMFPVKIVHRTKQREETVSTTRTCFLLKYWPQRLLRKSLLRNLYKVKCLMCKLLHSGEFPNEDKVCTCIFYNVFYLLSRLTNFFH